MNINVADLLNGNYILLLFVVLALGLCLGKLRLGSVQLGNSIGVLVVSLLLGQQHFAINTDALNLGFMLFIFCVGVEAGPNFFSIFFRDGKNYLMLALVMVGSAMLIAMVPVSYTHLDVYKRQVRIFAEVVQHGGENLFRRVEEGDAAAFQFFEVLRLQHQIPACLLYTSYQPRV